jgi:hypothetical protein
MSRLSQKDGLLRVELLALGGGEPLSRWFRSLSSKVNRPERVSTKLFTI